MSIFSIYSNLCAYEIDLSSHQLTVNWHRKIDSHRQTVSTSNGYSNYRCMRASMDMAWIFITVAQFGNLNLFSQDSSAWKNVNHTRYIRFVFVHLMSVLFYSAPHFGKHSVKVKCTHRIHSKNGQSIHVLWVVDCIQSADMPHGIRLKPKFYCGSVWFKYEREMSSLCSVNLFKALPEMGHFKQWTTIRATTHISFAGRTSTNIELKFCSPITIESVDLWVY